jgi:hypothetical protein
MKMYQDDTSNVKQNPLQWIYWKPEPKKRKWIPIPDTEQARATAIKQGAMFFTWASLSEPYSDNGGPEPRRWGNFVSDFDDLENPEKSIEEGRRFSLELLPALHDVDPYAIQYFHSGSRGPHITIPAILFGAENGDPYLPDIYKKIACEWAAKFQLETLDLSMYAMQKGKMFRIENVLRSNGRYKVPLTKDEFQFLPCNELLELTKSPRNIEPADVDLKPVESLIELYRRVRAEVYAELESYSRESTLTPEQIAKFSGNIPACINHILTGKRTTKTHKVNFNKLVMIAVTYFQAVGWGEKAAIEKSMGLIENFTDSDHYDTTEKRKDHFRSLWKYVEGKYAFNCLYVLGLKLPGSAFDCRSCTINLDEPAKPEVSEEAQTPTTEATESPASSDVDAKILELNTKHAVLMLGGRCQVMTEGMDPNFGRPNVSFSSVSDFLHYYGNQKVWIPNENGEKKPFDIAKLWLQSTKRRQYKGVGFFPQREVPGYYNFWRGFAIEPRPGNWDLMKNHIFSVICNGVQRYYDYLTAWLADAAQNPGVKRPGCCRGSQRRPGSWKGLPLL